jgi:hypothetical protein
VSHTGISDYGQGLKSAWLIIGVAIGVAAQTAREYPKEIRGYKVERTVVEVKRPRHTRNGKSTDDKGPRPENSDRSENKNGVADGESAANAGVDDLIQFGQPRLAGVTPLGISLEVPIVVAPVEKSGQVDFLMFEDMVVNGTSVQIEEYHHSFDLPNREPLTLGDPLRFYIYLPSAVLAAVGEWGNSKETWPVTGRVYVFGKFKKGPFSGKRCVPVELNLTMRNPMRSK